MMEIFHNNYNDHVMTLNKFEAMSNLRLHEATSTSRTCLPLREVVRLLLRLTIWDVRNDHIRDQA